MEFQKVVAFLPLPPPLRSYMNSVVRPGGAAFTKCTDSTGQLFASLHLSLRVPRDAPALLSMRMHRLNHLQPTKTTHTSMLRTAEANIHIFVFLKELHMQT